MCQSPGHLPGLSAQVSGERAFPGAQIRCEEQERQDLSAFIASVDRQVEGEFDLDKRVNILKDALTSHSKEVHFEKALRLATDKRDLVNSIVGQAHQYEERALFADALSGNPEDDLCLVPGAEN